MKFKYIFLILVGLTSGCSTSEEKPVEVGSDVDSLKKSVCPCGDLFYQNGPLI